jgi:hypothetical protein
MIPIMSGNTTTFMMVPIFDQFDVYELFDNKQWRKPSSIIAKSRGKRLDHDGPVRFGGVLRKLQFKRGEKKQHELYLESVFYTRLNS